MPTDLAATVGPTLLGLLGQVPEQAGGLRSLPLEPEPRLTIDGELVEAASGRRFDNRSPVNGEVVGSVADAGPDDTDRAIAAARRAFDDSAWAVDHELRRRSLEQLCDGLTRHGDQLRAALVTELGCPIRMTYGDQLDACIDKLGFYMELAEAYDYERDLGDQPLGPFTNHRSLVREPIGVVGCIVPWNLPVELALAKVGAALASGNTVVLKPSPETPWSATALGRIVVEETAMPPGVFNVVTSSSHERGAQLVADPRVDAIAFTGSTATGRKVMAAAAETLKRVTLELGGKSANVILDDVDLESVVPTAAAFACFNTGQSCILPSRLLVPESEHDRCVELAAAGMAAVPWGDPWDPDVFMGPLVSEAQRDRVARYVRLGIDEGARLVVGGGAADLGDGGWFFEPTLLADVEPTATVAREEIFGPVLSVLPYRHGDAGAIGLANDTEFGLAGYVWSADEERATAVARRMRTGMVAVNGGSFIGGDMPFGGRRQSGMGREWGLAGFEEFLDIKTIGTARHAGREGDT